MQPLATVCLLIGVHDEWALQVVKVDCVGHYLPFYASAIRAMEQEVVNFLEKKVGNMKGYVSIGVESHKCERVTSSWSWEGMVHWVKLSFSYIPWWCMRDLCYSTEGKCLHACMLALSLNHM
eukprot:9282495-Ditylum_brightwellii.AAC.1